MIDGVRIAIDYGRPAKRGRVIFDGLVPWGEVWRTGCRARAADAYSSARLRRKDPAE